MSGSADASRLEALIRGFQSCLLRLLRICLHGICRCCCAAIRRLLLLLLLLLRLVLLLLLSLLSTCCRLFLLCRCGLVLLRLLPLVPRLGPPVGLCSRWRRGGSAACSAEEAPTIV